MENSETYLILKTLITKQMFAIRHIELSNLLNNLQGKGQITDQEGKDLLALAQEQKIYDLPTRD